jgi:hypothetical protein
MLSGVVLVIMWLSGQLSTIKLLISGAWFRREQQADGECPQSQGCPEGGRGNHFIVQMTTSGGVLRCGDDATCTAAASWLGFNCEKTSVMACRKVLWS